MALSRSHHAENRGGDGRRQDRLLEEAAGRADRNRGRSCSRSKPTRPPWTWNRPPRACCCAALFPEGEKVPATHLIAVIGEGNESASEIDGFIKGDYATRIGACRSSAAPAATEPAIAAAPQASAPKEPSDQRVKPHPLARRLAQEKGIDLATIQGTGPDGRIEKEDVLRAATAKAAAPVRLHHQTAG
jgi:hypothetical protein